MSADRDFPLVRRARRGDRRAFEDLVRLHQDKVFTLVRSIVRSPDDAADVTQETFIAVLQHLGTFQEQSKFSTWLYRIAVRKAYDFLRTRRDEPTDEVAEIATGSDPHETHLQSQALRQAIAGLDESFRSVVVMIDVLGGSIEETAEAHSIAVGTVKSRLFRGRAQLAAALGTSGVFESSKRRAP